MYGQYTQLSGIRSASGFCARPQTIWQSFIRRLGSGKKVASKESLDLCYMTCAEAHASLSRGIRAKVGVVIVTRNGTILGGCNGLAQGSSNILEYVDSEGKLVTKPEVIHGEVNAILKAAREGVSVVGGTLYTTMSCCKPCSEMVAAAGISRVVYKEAYRDTSGIENLRNLGVKVEQFKED